MEQYQQQVEPEATQATTPEELHPVAAAFGGDIGAALEKSGSEVADRIQTLSLHMARMNFYRGEAQKADLVNQYKTSLQTKLYGDPNDPNATVTSIGGQVMPSADKLTLSAGSSPSNITPTATPVEIPAGVYNRKGYAAAGALQDIDAWHQQTSNEILQQGKGLGLRNMASLKTQLDNAWSAERMGIVKHESEQLDQAQQQTWFKGMQLDADNATTKQDPVSLGRTIDSINQTNQVLNDHQGKSADDPIRDLTSDKFVGQALNNSINTILKTTNDPNQAQSVLDNLHDNGKISDLQYENATTHAGQAYKAISNENNRQIRIGQVNADMNTMSKVLQGDMSVTSVNAINDLAQNNKPLADAMTAWTLHKDDPVDSDKMKDEDKITASLTKNIFDSGSKEEQNGYLQQAFKDSAEGRLSQDKLNIIVGAAMDRGKNIADLKDDPDKGNPVQNLIDQGMKVLFGTNAHEEHPNANTLTDYMKQIKEGKTVPDAIQHAQGQDAVRQNPHLLNIPPNGQIFHDKHGNRRIVYPDLHTEAIGGKTATSGKEDDNSDD